MLKYWTGLALTLLATALFIPPYVMFVYMSIAGDLLYIAWDWTTAKVLKWSRRS